MANAITIDSILGFSWFFGDITRLYTDADFDFTNVYRRDWLPHSGLTKIIISCLITRNFSALSSIINLWSLSRIALLSPVCRILFIKNSELPSITSHKLTCFSRSCPTCYCKLYSSWTTPSPHKRGVSNFWWTATVFFASKEIAEKAFLILEVWCAKYVSASSSDGVVYNLRSKSTR